MIKISGIVIEGEKKGRELTFPTANIRLSEDIADGVYQGKVYIDGQEYKAALFISNRMLEAHIIDFNGNLYGRTIQVEIQQKIHPVRKFANDDELKDQIAQDVEVIRRS